MTYQRGALHLKHQPLEAFFFGRRDPKLSNYHVASRYYMKQRCYVLKAESRSPLANNTLSSSLVIGLVEEEIQRFKFVT